MKKITTINNIEMIQCGDYNWEVLKENGGSEVYYLLLRNKNQNTMDIALYYGNCIFSVRYNKGPYCSDDNDFFCFKMGFNDTPLMVKRLLEGEDCYLLPIYHKDTVKIKTA